jgi:hypothetical protein
MQRKGVYTFIELSRQQLVHPLMALDRPHAFELG